jgi:hypothetical protein
MFAAAQPPWLMVLAVEYSGRKLHGVPLQLAIEVFMKPFLAEASMNPVRPELRSRTLVSSAPAFRLSKIRIWSLSPGFISRVRWLGVTVLRFARCGLGGPVGTPLLWRKAKLTGSTHLLLQTPVVVHSSESIVSAAHQWALSQLRPSANGANPGG